MNGRNRRVSPVAPLRREGPLIEPTAGAQPWPRERVLMPHTGHCPELVDAADAALRMSGIEFDDVWAATERLVEQRHGAIDKVA